MAATATRPASGFGALDLVRSNVPQHLDIPAVEGVETYLSSLANPARDLTALKVRGWGRVVVLRTVKNRGMLLHRWHDECGDGFSAPR